MRFFNTSGPVVPADHYLLPPLERVDLGQIRKLIQRKRYFLLHAPRQTGKTSALLALRDLLNREGAVGCVYANVEGAQTARENVGETMRTVLSVLREEAESTLGTTSLGDLWSGVLESAGPHDALRLALVRWSASEPKPLVLLLDEVDALVGDSLIAVLRQLRSGYPKRPARFPQSVVLCGVRDVRDYRIHSSAEKTVITGGSAFNIKARSFRMGDFTAAEVRTLLAQHTAEAGQEFTAGALEAVWEQTRGQPWLVNALADEACERVPDHRCPIRGADILDARETLIRRRETHLDQLVDKLQEPRVRRVVEPLLADRPGADSLPDDDLQYVQDLGLISQAAPVEIANPIYREVIPRALTWTTQAQLRQVTGWYVKPGGRLDVEALLRAFQQFFREHAEHWLDRFAYREAGPQLLLQAFLQRVVNAGGRIEREYGQGRRRVDLLVIWGEGPDPRALQRAVIECKVVHRGRERTIREGLRQTREYLDLSGAGEGHLVVFDRRPDRTWGERIFRREETADGPPVTVWGM